MYSCSIMGHFRQAGEKGGSPEEPWLHTELLNTVNIKSHIKCGSQYELAEEDQDNVMYSVIFCLLHPQFC